jgi:hypothetical protein
VPTASWAVCRSGSAVLTLDLEVLTSNLFVPTLGAPARESERVAFERESERVAFERELEGMAFEHEHELERVAFEHDTPARAPAGFASPGVPERHPGPPYVPCRHESPTAFAKRVEFERLVFHGLGAGQGRGTPGRAAARSPASPRRRVIGSSYLPVGGTGARSTCREAARVPDRWARTCARYRPAGG